MSIVSIAEELRVHQLKQVLDSLRQAYACTFEDLGRCAVAWDEAVTHQYRTALADIAVRSGAASRSVPLLAEFQASVRRTLESHKQRAEDYLAALHRQLRESAEALSRLVCSLATQEGDGQVIGDALVELRRTADLDDIAEVRRQVLGLTATLTECVESIRRQNSLVVAQLTDEISLLHRQIERLQPTAKAESKEGSPGPCTVGLPAMVEDAIVADRPFCLALVYVRDLDTIRVQDGASRAAEVADYCLRRMTELSLPISQAGIWNAGILGALLAEDSVQLDVSRVITRGLGGVHSIHIDGVLQKYDLRVSTALLNRPSAELRARTYQRLAALLHALGSPAP